MARSTATTFLVVWSVLFLRERPTAGGAVGLVVIILVLLIVGGSNWLQANGGSHFRQLGPALLVALFISIYMAIDGAAGKRTESLGHATLIYFVSALYMTLFILWWHGWQPLKNEFSAHCWQLLGIGVLIVSAYLMALFAYSIASMSYSGSIREVGVVMGAFAVRKILGEKFGGMRVGGAVVIFIRMLVIAFFG